MVYSLLIPDPAAIRFLQNIRDCEASSIFEVELDGERYALKVFHDDGDPGYTNSGRDLNRFRNERNAYQRLHASGVCDIGLVPKYYGFIDRLDPSSHEPWLDHFTQDQFHPSAILLEYLVDVEELNCVNYSPERHSRALEALDQVHNALILHNDIYPKNILIVPGSPERVMLIDFDVAELFPSREAMDQDIVPIENTQGWKLERGVLEDFGKHLAEDQREGLPPNTKFY